MARLKVWNDNLGEWEYVNSPTPVGAMPAGGSTGQKLVKTSDDDYDTEWDDDDGSLPEGAEIGDVLATIAKRSPTFAEVVAANPAIYVEGWSATHNYAADIPTGDGVQFLKPAGTVNTFVAEVNGGLTGGSEPNWDADAPDVGDTITDGDVTWYNVGPLADFAAPTTWAAETEYTCPAFVWPTDPNGHLYVSFPGYPSGLGPMTSGVSEPNFPVNQDEFGFAYIDDGDGYWQDLGTTLIAITAWDEILPTPVGVSEGSPLIVRDNEAVWGSGRLATQTIDFEFSVAGTYRAVVPFPRAPNRPVGASHTSNGPIMAGMLIEAHLAGWTDKLLTIQPVGAMGTNKWFEEFDIAGHDRFTLETEGDNVSHLGKGIWGPTPDWQQGGNRGGDVEVIIEVTGTGTGDTYASVTLIWIVPGLGVLAELVV